MDLSSVTSCAEIIYLCVQLQKGQAPNPDFTLQGNTVQCLNVECTSKSLFASLLSKSLLWDFAISDNCSSRFDCCYNVGFHLAFEKDSARVGTSGH